MKHYKLAFLLLTFFCQLSLAQKNMVLVVTHPTKYYDHDKAAKAGILQAVKAVDKKKSKVIYLVEELPDTNQRNIDDIKNFYNKRGYYFDVTIGTLLQSYAGELNTQKFDYDHVMVAGGYMDACLSNSLMGIVKIKFEHGQKNFHIDLITDAIYLEQENPNRTYTLQQALKTSKNKSKFVISHLIGFNTMIYPVKLKLHIDNQQEIFGDVNAADIIDIYLRTSSELKSN